MDILKNISTDEACFIDAVESRMMNEMVQSGDYELIGNQNRDTEHVFTQGLYGRKLTMMPGDRIVSKIHKTRHQFVILQGCALVYQNGEEVLLEAPYSGITEAGTRRVLMIPENSDPCIWMTFHPNPDDENVEQIEERIIEKHDNPLLTSEQKKFLSNTCVLEDVEY